MTRTSRMSVSSRLVQELAGSRQGLFYCTAHDVQLRERPVRGCRSMLTLTARRRGGLADDAQIAQRGAQALAPDVHFGVFAVDLDHRAFEPQRAHRYADAGLEIGRGSGAGRRRRRAGGSPPLLSRARTASSAARHPARAIPTSPVLIAAAPRRSPACAQHGGARLQPVDHRVDLAARVAQLVVHLRREPSAERVLLLAQRRLLRPRSAARPRPARAAARAETAPLLLERPQLLIDAREVRRQLLLAVRSRSRARPR